MTPAVGIDVGGTKILAALVDVDDGTVLKRQRLPSRIERGGRAVLGDAIALAESLADGTGCPIGIGLCELVSRDGRATDAYRIDWRGIDIPSTFSHVGPAVLESDVRAAALAEARFGSGRGVSDFIYVTVGTGISFSLVLDGAPYAGSHGYALLVGAPQVEHVASGSALAVLAGVRDAEELFAAERHDVLIQKGAEALGQAIAWLVHALDPALVVVGGGLGMNERYRRAYAAAARQLIEFDPGPPIVTAETGSDAGVVGAALLGANRAAATSDR